MPMRLLTFARVLLSASRLATAPPHRTRHGGVLALQFIKLFSTAVERLPYQDEATGHLLVQVAPMVASLCTGGDAGDGDGQHLALSASYGSVPLLSGTVAADGTKRRFAFDLTDPHLPRTGTFNVTATLACASDSTSASAGVTASSGAHAEGRRGSIRGSSAAAPAETAATSLVSRMPLTEQAPLLRVAPKPTAVVVDRASRGLIVGGAPFVASGWFVDARLPLAGQVDKVRQLATHGHNMVVNYRTINFTDAALVAFMDAAAQVGVYVQLAVLSESEAIIKGPPTVPTNAPQYAAHYQQMQHWVDLVGDHPALLGWYITDDTVGDNATRVADVYDWVKGADPWHPVFNTFSGSGQAWEYMSPRVGYDVPQYEAYFMGNPGYQTATVPLTWPNNWVPAFICGQGFESYQTTPRATSLQTMISAMYGASGVVWWDMWPWAVATYWQLFQATSTSAAVLHHMVPALLSSDVSPAPAIAVDNDNVAVMAFREASAEAPRCLRVFVANLALAPQAFTLSSPELAPAAAGGADNVTAMFETRLVVVNTTTTTTTAAASTSSTSGGVNGTISEYLGSYETRVYAVSCADPTYWQQSGDTPHTGVATIGPASQQAPVNPRLGRTPGPGLGPIVAPMRRALQQPPSTASHAGTQATPTPTLAQRAVAGVGARDGPGANLVHNGDMGSAIVPTVVDGQQLGAKAWEASTQNRTADMAYLPTVYADASTAATGRNSLRLVVPAPLAAGVAHLQVASDSDALVTQGSTYTVSLWLRRPVPLPSEASQPVVVSVEGPGGLVANVTLSELAAPWQWVQWRGTFTAKDTGGMQIGVHRPGVLWVDGVVVTQVQGVQGQQPAVPAAW